MIATHERQRTLENGCGSERKGGEKGKHIEREEGVRRRNDSKTNAVPPKTRRLLYVYSQLVKIQEEIDVLHFSLCLGTANTMNTEFSVLEVE